MGLHVHRWNPRGILCHQRRVWASLAYSVLLFYSGGSEDYGVRYEDYFPDPVAIAATREEAFKVYRGTLNQIGGWYMSGDWMTFSTEPVNQGSQVLRVA